MGIEVVGTITIQYRLLTFNGDIAIEFTISEAG